MENKIKSIIENIQAFGIILTASQTEYVYKCLKNAWYEGKIEGLFEGRGMKKEETGSEDL